MGDPVPRCTALRAKSTATLLLPIRKGWESLHPDETATMLCSPLSFAVLPGGDYIVFDSGDKRLKRATKQVGTGGSGGGGGRYTISTIAGSSNGKGARCGRSVLDGVGREATFFQVFTIAINLDLTSCTLSDPPRIRTINLLTGAVTTLAGNGRMKVVDGIGGAASFDVCAGVSLLPDGRAAVTEMRQGGVRLVSTATGETTTLCECSNKGPPAKLPTSVAVLPSGGDGDGGGGARLLVAESETHQILAVAVDDQTVSTYAGSGGVVGSNDGTVATATFDHPSKLAVDTRGRVAVLDVDRAGDSRGRSRQRVRIIDPAKDSVRTLEVADDLDGPVHLGRSDMAIDSNGDIVVMQTSKGISVLTNTGLSAGYYGWKTSLGWLPTVEHHHMLCSPNGKAAVWAVLSVAYRTHWQQFDAPIGDATRQSVTASVPHPALPLELWHLILQGAKIRELGATGLVGKRATKAKEFPREEVGWNEGAAREDYIALHGQYQTMREGAKAMTKELEGVAAACATLKQEQESHAVTFSGASGPLAPVINGTFARANERANGEPVWLKVDDPTLCLWRARCWMVGPAADKNPNHGNACCSMEAGLDSPLGSTQWLVPEVDDGEECWVLQPAITCVQVEAETALSREKLVRLRLQHTSMRQQLDRNIKQQQATHAQLKQQQQQFADRMAAEPPLNSKRSITSLASRPAFVYATNAL